MTVRCRVIGHTRVVRLALFSALLVALGAAGGALAPPAAASFPVPGEMLASHVIDGASHADDRFVDVTRSPDGSLYALGVIDFQWSALPGKIYLQKCDAGGNLVWNRSYTVPGATGVYPMAVTADSEGNVIAVANATDGTDRDIFVIKWDAAGVVQWTAVKGSADPDLDDEVTGVVTDKTGDVYVCGAMGDGTSAAVVKYNDEADPLHPLTGLEEWANSTTGNHATSSALASGITIDSSGNLYVTGERLMKTGDDNVYVQKLRGSSGGTLWLRGWDGASHKHDGGTVVRYRGRYVYVGGESETKTHSNDIVVLRYAARTGARSWVRTWDNATTHNSDEISDLRVDGYGNAYVTATTFYMTTVKYKALLLKIGRTGTVKWKRTYYDTASNGYGTWWSLSVDSAGNAWTVGFVTTSTHPMWIVARYSASGKRAWLTRWDGPAHTGADGGNACTLAGDNLLFVAGSVAGAGELDDAGVAWLYR